MGGKATVIRPLADFLHAYQLDGGYTPGPLYLAATVLGLVGTLSLIRRKRRSAIAADRQLALACCLFFLSAAAILLFSDFTEFSWRYQLPAIMTLPPAGALGLAVILAKISSRRKPAAAASGAADATANAADSTANAGDGTANTADSTANAGDGTANAADSAVAADTRPPTMRTAPDDSAPRRQRPGLPPAGQRRRGEPRAGPAGQAARPSRAPAARRTSMSVTLPTAPPMPARPERCRTRPRPGLSRPPPACAPRARS